MIDRVEKAILMIQKPYAVAREIRENTLIVSQAKEIRLEKSLPMLNDIGKWIFEEIKITSPKSQIGKAMAYAYARWDALSAYLYDGTLQIDNYYMYA